MSFTDTNQLVTRDDYAATFGRHARTIVIHHGEKILAEIPSTLRRLRTMMLVATISIPVFLVALLALVWRLT
jgi:hypothetical protein